MRNRFLMLVVVVATLFACNSDSMISDDMNKKGGERPFKVKNLVGTYEFGPNVDPEFCDPSPLGLIAEGEGTIPHLGLSTVLEEWCWDGSPFDVGQRRVTFTAANGDQLTGRMDDPVDYFAFPDTSIFREVVTIDGGNGRFANASGTITQIVDTNPDASQTQTEGFGTFTYSAEGTISY